MTYKEAEKEIEMIERRMLRNSLMINTPFVEFVITYLKKNLKTITNQYNLHESYMMRER